ncbi:MAG: hypothetical protein ABDH37_05850 [Candidatus Hydrothermales bacterium]
MIIEYPSSIHFSEKLNFFCKENERVYVIKSKDLLKAELFAFNLIKSFGKPYFSINFEFDDKSLLFIKIFKIISEHLKEEGISHYSFDELKNFFKDHIIFLPYIPQNLISFLKNLSEFFIHLKFIALSDKDIDKDLFEIDVDELQLGYVDTLLDNVYEKFEKTLNVKDEIKDILIISLNFPLFNPKILSDLTGLSESFLIEKLSFINKNFFPFFKVKKHFKDKNFYLTISKFLREKFYSLCKGDASICKKFGEFYEREGLTEYAMKVYLDYNDLESFNDLLKKNLLRFFSDDEFSGYVRYFIKDIEDRKAENLEAILILKGDYYIRNYDLKKAEELIKKASEVLEEKLIPFLKIIELNLFWERGEDEKVIKYYEEINKEKLPEPLRAYLLYRAGSSFVMLEKMEKAEQCLFESLSLAMDLGNLELALDVSNNLGYLIRSFHSNLEIAIELFKKRAYTPTPNLRNVLALFNLGYVYAFLGKFEEANKYLDELENLLKLLGASDKTSYFYLKGIIHLFKGEFKEATYSMEEILNFTKRPITIFNISIYLSKLCFLMGEVEKGFNYIKKAIDSYKPTSTLEKNSVNIAKAMGLYISKRKEELIQLLKELKNKERFLTNEEKIIFYYLQKKTFNEENFKELFENFLNKTKAVNFIENF